MDSVCKNINEALMAMGINNEVYRTNKEIYKIYKFLSSGKHSIDEIEQEDQENFKRLYAHYCLEPAINMRRIIRQQCHLLDKEFKAEMGEFKMRE